MDENQQLAKTQRSIDTNTSITLRVSAQFSQETYLLVRLDPLVNGRYRRTGTVPQTEDCFLDYDDGGHFQKQNLVVCKKSDLGAAT